MQCKRLILAVLVIAAVGTVVYSQSRRVPPANPDKRANERPRTIPATPTPPLAEDETAADVDSDEVITVDTKLVTLPVRIIDRKGRFVGGISEKSFKVFEDNVAQDIAHFSNESQPFTVALVLDMSYSAKFKAEEIQSAAISFVNLLRPEDRVIIIAFDEEVQMLSDATNDRRAIYRAIRQTQIGTGTSLYEAVDMTINDRLRSIEGRKAIVLFTDGVDTTSRRATDRDNLGDALELDSLIYPIRYDTFADVQAMMRGGSTINLPTSRTTGTPPIAGGGGGSPFPMPVPVMGTPSSRGTTAEEYAHGEEYLNQLASRTGGTMYVASTLGNLNSAFARIASELREFYSIGYYPKEEGTPGKTRRVRVKVDRQNVAVKSRSSYVVSGNTRK